MGNKILFLDTHPFGKLTDCYKWCEYLRSDYEITLICLDDDAHVEMEGVNIVRVSARSGYRVRGTRYILTCLWHLLFFKGFIFVVYFDHCDFLKKVIFWKKMHVDVRTVDVRSLLNMEAQDKYDRAMRKACSVFDSISVISEGVRQRLHLDEAYLLPLGADIISSKKKQYESLHLIYVGTFDYRHLEDTIQGLALFAKKYPNANVQYELIGDGHHQELENCKRLVNEMLLQDKVMFHGRIDNRKLSPFFDRSNIGVSYVPINPVYNVQPPTKTFEYTLSGLYCIATGTDENKKVINSNNGIIIHDNPQSFCDALEYIFLHKDEIKEYEVRKSLADYTWGRIVQMSLKPILEMNK